MRRSAIAASALLILLLAGTALAGPPLSGAYKSVDIGGPVYVGRYTEGWAAGGGAIFAGATLNAESWDGATLGAQWKYWCGTQVSNSILLINTVDVNGNGNRTYMSTFVGGYIWLSGSGPWANGDPDYPGVIDNYAEFETITYQNWVPISAVTNVQAMAHFNNYPALCMTFYIGNGSRVATTDLGDPIPPNYPAFLDPACSPTETLGACWDFFTITLTLTNCAVGTEQSTWGAIKSIYGK
jgi:hypothetical protein